VWLIARNYTLQGIVGVGIHSDGAKDSGLWVFTPSGGVMNAGCFLQVCLTLEDEGGTVRQNVGIQFPGIQRNNPEDLCSASCQAYNVSRVASVCARSVTHS